VVTGSCRLLYGKIDDPRSGPITRVRLGCVSRKEFIDAHVSERVSTEMVASAVVSSPALGAGVEVGGLGGLV